MFSKFQNPFPTDNFKKYSKRTNPKITILEISLYKIQPEIIKFKIFTCFNFITKYYNKVEMRKDFIISGCILYTKISGIVIFGVVLLYFNSKF